jgi:hypothetical protein
MAGMPLAEEAYCCWHLPKRVQHEGQNENGDIANRLTIRNMLKVLHREPTGKRCRTCRFLCRMLHPPEDIDPGSAAPQTTEAGYATIHVSTCLRTKCLVKKVIDELVAESRVQVT